MNKVQEKFVCDALDQPEKLSEWEYDFLNNIAELPEWVDLSKKQNEILNRIQRKLD